MASPPLLRSLPARERLDLPAPEPVGPPPLRLGRVARASRLRVAVRIARWSIGFFGFLAEVGLDRVRGARSDHRLGIRFRAMFQRIGGTAVTVGQEIATRMDILPIAVCDELSHLEDSGPPISIETALDQIRRSLHRDPAELFTLIDPVPISSNVTACMFQAMTDHVTKVVIQVRRPGIEMALDADIRAVSFLLLLAEQLTILPPGRLRVLRENLRDMVLEELDFVERTRHQEVFRRQAKKAGIKKATAPKVARQMIGHQVSVNAFVGGVYLSEVVEAKEKGDLEALAALRARGIVPEELARRIALAFWWSLYEGPFFYADPHPSNIVVQDGGVVQFIDWPRCGAVHFRLRNLHRRITICLWDGRVSEAATLMVQTLLPLPRLDVHDFTKELEQRLWDCSQAMRHVQSPPWERTTAAAWIALLGMARSFGLCVNLDVLRVIHSTLLYDALISRLSDEIDRSLFRRYEREAARRRVAERLGSISLERANLLVRADDLVDRVDEARIWVEGAMAGMPANDLYMSDKASYIADVLIRYLSGIAWFLAAAVAFQLATYGRGLSIGDVIRSIVTSGPFQVVAAVAALVAFRLIVFRIQDVDVES